MVIMVVIEATVVVAMSVAMVMATMAELAATVVMTTAV